MTILIIFDHKFNHYFDFFQLFIYYYFINDVF